MGLEIKYIPGQTPIDEEEREGLLIKTITSQSELNEFEQQNIQAGIQWTLGRRFKVGEVLTEEFVNRVHRKMLGEVWSWAGEFRKTEKNLGVKPYEIPIQLKMLLDDCTYWADHETYLPDEIAVRFKHRLVSIHCYSNGNGRHSRLMGDIIIEHVFRKPLFSWGSGANLVQGNAAREQYIKAVKAADNGNFELLLAFARS